VEFITGVRNINSDADWNAYLADLDRLNSKEVLAIRQKNLKLEILFPLKKCAICLSAVTSGKACQLEKKKGQKGEEGKQHGIGDFDEGHLFPDKLGKRQRLLSFVAKQYQQGGRQGCGQGVAEEGGKGKGAAA
jgi:hypothetical protein